MRYRKHGVQFDRYFSIRYKLDPKDCEEGIGWASEENTAVDAHALMADRKYNIKRGTGPRTLGEKRELEEKTSAAAELAKAAEAIANITWGEIWHQYNTSAKGTKSPNSVRTEKNLKACWIKRPFPIQPRCAPFRPSTWKKLPSAITKASKAPRTVQYALGVIRGVFNYARRHDLFTGENPTGKIRMPKFDNRRMRFLTRGEADRLLDKLAEASTDVHDKTLLSLHAGLRLGEINALTWADVDLARGVLTLRDTKNTRTRTGFLTGQVLAAACFTQAIWPILTALARARPVCG